MNCQICGDRGVLRMRYRDGSPDDYGVCQCEPGQVLRNDRNADKATGYSLWMLWAAARGITYERVCLIEELLEDAELAKIPAAEGPSMVSRVADAVRTTKRPRL